MNRDHNKMTFREQRMNWLGLSRLIQLLNQNQKIIRNNQLIKTIHYNKYKANIIMLSNKCNNNR